MRKLLVIVDFQNDFVLQNGALFVPNANKLIEQASKSLTKNKLKEYDDILVQFDTHTEVDYPSTEESKQFPIHCIPGTFGWNLAFKDLDVLDYLHSYAYHAFKPQFDIWRGASYVKQDIMVGVSIPTTETQFLANHSNNEWEVHVFGIAGDVCVKETIIGWVMRGYKVTAFRNLIVGFEKDIDTIREEIGLDFNIVNSETIT
ncbi:hypothetical protein CMI47_13165 [Candidatus Pacearchaeota archaeon]|nr:hypothetical protein [Candidatus Pacearchaeota archaeon]|tara:strand:+ start:15148 stop:15753 length:606 start_codon:yes stop_codon:yes gene_type:complete